MGKVIAQASMSLDGFIADTSDQVGPLFDWYTNGDAEVAGHPDIRTSQASELQGSHDRPASCSPSWPRCREWSASASATAPWKATSRPAPAARRSAAPPSPTTPCSPSPCTSAARS